MLTVVEQVAEFVNEVRSRLTGPEEAFTGPEDWADFLTRKARMFAVVAASPYSPPSASEVAEEAAAEAAEAWREAEEARREAGHAGSDHAGSAGDRRVGA